MSLLKIARMGHPVLRQPAMAIETHDIPALGGLIDDMIETMHDAAGIGLAAPQVHLPLRLIVFLPITARGEDAPGTRVLINPTFEPLSNETDIDWEGCLSIPDIRGEVQRFTHIRYRGLDRSGKIIEATASHLHARVVQHEIDHLDGTLYLDRMHDMQSLMFNSEARFYQEPSDDV